MLLCENFYNFTKNYLQDVWLTHVLTAWDEYFVIPCCECADQILLVIHLHFNINIHNICSNSKKLESGSDREETTL